MTAPVEVATEADIDDSTKRKRIRVSLKNDMLAVAKGRHNHMAL